MKKFLILIVALMVAVMALAGSTLGVSALRNFTSNALRGSGNLVERRIEALTYSGISASRSVEVVIAKEPAKEILIKADDNVIDHVQVYTNGGVLVATINKEFRNISNIHVTVTIPPAKRIESLKVSSAAAIIGNSVLAAEELDIEASSSGRIEVAAGCGDCEIDASSAAKVEFSGKCGNLEIEASSAAKVLFKGQCTAFEADASSAAKIEAEVKCTSCEAQATSSGKVLLEGETPYATFRASSAAKIDASDFEAGEVNANASSGASIHTHCITALSAAASSGANIRYTGGCKTVIRTSSGGKVRTM